VGAASPAWISKGICGALAPMIPGGHEQEEQ
jgi:hypothetical protein